MTTIYVVQKGCYSDRGISAIFSTREKAEEYISTYSEPGVEPRFLSESFDIEEFTIDDPEEARLQNPGMFPFEVRMREEDAAPPRYEWDEGCVPGATVRRMDSPPHSGMVTAPSWGSLDNYGDWTELEVKDLITQCWARDEEHAIKIATERRAEFLANWRQNPSKMSKIFEVKSGK